MTTLTVGPTTSSASAAYSQGYVYVTLGTVPSPGGTLTEVNFSANGAAGSPVVAGVIYANSANTPTTRLAMTSTVTGVTNGLNTLTLTSPLAVTTGQTLFIGLHITVAAVNVRATPSTGTNRFWADAAYPPDDPAGSAFTYADQWMFYATGTTPAGSGGVVWVGI